MDSEPGPVSTAGEKARRAPRNRRRRGLIRLAIVLAVVAVVFVAASLAAAAYTERDSFCEHACHEMEPYGATWEASAHHDILSLIHISEPTRRTPISYAVFCL